MGIAQQDACIYLHTYKTCSQSIQVCSCLTPPAPCPQTHRFLWAVSQSPVTPLREVTEQPQPSLEEHLVHHGRTQHVPCPQPVPCPWPPCPAWSSLWFPGNEHLGKTDHGGWVSQTQRAFFTVFKENSFNGKRGVMVIEESLRAGRDLPPIAKGRGRGLLCLKTGLAGISRGGG